jgi:hypothetical protein
LAACLYSNKDMSNIKLVGRVGRRTAQFPLTPRSVTGFLND